MYTLYIPVVNKDRPFYNYSQIVVDYTLAKRAIEYLFLKFKAYMCCSEVCFYVYMFVCSLCNVPMLDSDLAV